MKGWLVSACIFILMTSGFGENKPTKSTVPLTADEVAIYKAILQEYTVAKSVSLNVSAKTYPLDPESHMNGLTEACPKGIQLDNLSTVVHTYHDLTPGVLTRNTRLVNPSRQAILIRKNDPQNVVGTGESIEVAVKRAYDTALFSLSEIAFDKDHRYAAVTYSFWCGSLCGDGSTLVFEKVGNVWKKTDRRCGGWVS